MLLQCCSDRQMDAQLVLASLIQIGCQQIYDLFHILIVQLVEHDNVIDTVDEFRLEAALYLFHDIGFHFLIILRLALLRCEAEILGIYNPLCSGVGCHNQHRILEADLSALGIRNMTVIQHLQKYVEHIRMSLFDLIKQNDRIRIPADLLAQLATFFKSHISGRGTDHLRYRMTFHILRHIHTDHGIFRAEHSLCKRLG